MQKDGDKHLFLLFHDGFEQSLRNVVGLIAFTVVVIIRVVLLAIVCQGVERDVRVYVTGLNINHVNVLVHEQLGSQRIGIGEQSMLGRTIFDSKYRALRIKLSLHYQSK